LAITSLSCVEIEKQLLSDGDDRVITNVACLALHNLPQQQTGSLMLFRIAERLE